MKRSEIAAIKAEHAFSNGRGGDRAACSCGWDYGSRIGTVTVARQRHRSHVTEVLAAAKEAQS